MEVGAHGQCGRTAQPHAVQGHRRELVLVSIHNPRLEVTLVMADRMTLSLVLQPCVQVSMWS